MALALPEMESVYKGYNTDVRLNLDPGKGKGFNECLLLWAGVTDHWLKSGKPAVC